MGVTSMSNSDDVPAMGTSDTAGGTTTLGTGTGGACAGTCAAPTCHTIRDSSKPTAPQVGTHACADAPISSGPGGTRPKFQAGMNALQNLVCKHSLMLIDTQLYKQQPITPSALVTSATMCALLFLVNGSVQLWIVGLWANRLVLGLVLCDQRPCSLLLCMQHVPCMCCCNAAVLVLPVM